MLRIFCSCFLLWVACLNASCSKAIYYPFGWREEALSFFWEEAHFPVPEEEILKLCQRRFSPTESQNIWVLTSPSSSLAADIQKAFPQSKVTEIAVHPKSDVLHAVRPMHSALFQDGKEIDFFLIASTEEGLEESYSLIKKSYTELKRGGELLICLYPTQSSEFLQNLESFFEGDRWSRFKGEHPLYKHHCLSHVVSKLYHLGFRGIQKEAFPFEYPSDARLFKESFRDIILNIIPPSLTDTCYKAWRVSYENTKFFKEELTLISASMD